MAEMKHYTTAAEDCVSLAHKIIYGFAAFVNNLLAVALGGMATALNLGQCLHTALESANHKQIKIIGVRCGRQLI